MNDKFAGCGEHQSGQRFLSGSAPRLIRHVASCKTAGGELPSLPAGKGQKPLREFEGGALISAEGAVPSSLDSVQINRDRPEGWKRNCGAYTARGASKKEAGKTRYCRIGCKCW